MTDQKKTTKKKRPAHRDISVGTKISPEVARRARAKAKKEKRSLSVILRAFLLAWVDDEVDSPAVREDETTRAKKRARKKPLE